LGLADKCYLGIFTFVLGKVENIGEVLMCGSKLNGAVIVWQGLGGRP
jgi:hypothetical protein